MEADELKPALPDLPEVRVLCLAPKAHPGRGNERVWKAWEAIRDSMNGTLCPRNCDSVFD